MNFRTWAPNAVKVSVAGSFNGWSTTSLPLIDEGGGVWSRDVPGAMPGQPYKYVINDALWRRDPYSRQIDPDGSRNSLIPNPSLFDWGPQDFVMPPPNEWVIYEMHVGTFFDPIPSSGQTSGFTNALKQLDHLVDLGINAVELMPISEFPTATSWGYNLSYPFAIESTYGTPDQTKAFIKACHDRGIAVLMDIVHNHWGSDSDDWSLWQYDGWSADGYGGIFFYNEPDLCCTYWGPRPDYSRAEVRNYIVDNFRMWKEEYRIDGFRWDAPKHILYTDSSQTIEVPHGGPLIDEVIQALAVEYPGTYNIAEDIKGVVGFDSHWDLGFQWSLQNMMGQGSDADRDMTVLAGLIGSDPNRIIYSESHDTTGDLNGGQRFPVAIDGANGESYWARKRSTLAAVIAMTSPGTPMILQGQELLTTEQFGDTKPLDWTRTNTFSHITRFYRDLIHLRRNMEGVSGGLQGAGHGFLLVNDSDKVVGYRRYDPAQPGQDVVVYLNLKNTVQSNITVPFPDAGTWYVQLNSDRAAYGTDYDDIGDEQVDATGSPATASINLGRYSAVIFSKVPRSGLLVEDLIMEDAALGNGNGVLEPGETVYFSPVLHNRGQVAVGEVLGSLSATHEEVEVLQPWIRWPGLDAGSTATGSAPFVVHMPTNWPCGQPLGLSLLLTENERVTTQRLFHPVGAFVSSGTSTSSYQSADIPKAILDRQTIYSELLVGDPGLGVIERVKVRVRLDHTYTRDVVIAVQHPDGTEILLSNRRGSSSDDFGTGACGPETVYTIFDADAAVPIADGRGPFAGTYRPDDDLTLLQGKWSSGLWRLRVSDASSRDEGTLLCWGLDLTAAQSGYDCDPYSASVSEHGDDVPDWWKIWHFGGITNVPVTVDSDGDGFDNRSEYLAGTDPWDPASRLAIQTAEQGASDSGIAIRWSSVGGRSYRVTRTDSLTADTYVLVQSNILATPTVNTLTDTTAQAQTGFYRVELE